MVNYFKQQNRLFQWPVMLTMIVMLSTTGLVGCAKSKAKPLKCPSGAEIIGSGPPTGKREYCAKPHKKTGELIKHGPWRSFWPNGKVESTRVYKKGKEHGKFRTFTMDGKKILEGRYEKGLKVGVWRKYARSGVLAKESEYVDGQRHGTVKIYDETGLLEQTLKYNNGRQVGR